MNEIVTNIISLALKSKTRDSCLYDAVLELDNGSKITVKDYEYDDESGMFLIESMDGKLYIIPASKKGKASNIDLTKPIGTRQKVIKLK